MKACIRVYYMYVRTVLCSVHCPLPKNNIYLCNQKGPFSLKIRRPKNADGEINTASKQILQTGATK